MKPISAWHWFRDMVAPSSNPSDGAILYAESGVMKIRQADGTTFPLAPATSGSGGILDGGGPATTYTGAVHMDLGGVT